MHISPEIRTVDIDTAFRQVQQDSSRTAGNVHHTAGAVFPGQIQVKLLKTLMVICSLGIHSLKVKVIVFGDIPEIVQIHGTPPHFF